jgi:hypothetical protein
MSDTIPSSAPPGAPLTKQERLAELRRRIYEIEKKNDSEDEDRLLRMAELEVEYTEKFGRRGEDWDLVDAGPHGPIVVKRGDAVTAKAYRAKLRKANYSPTDEDDIAFVTPNVEYPSTKELHEIIFNRKFLLPKLVDAVSTLFGLWEDKAQKK